jgi:pilus assembly protein CpaB
MSSVASRANPERTNRWLLIGAAILAVIAGVLVFALLANSGGSDNNKSSAPNVPAGSTSVLVAKQAISSGTLVTADMFETKNVANKSLVPGFVTESSAVIGQTASVNIAAGQQLSTAAFATPGTAGSLAQKIRPGLLGYSIPVNAVQLVSGLVLPNDNVDIIATYTEKRGDQDVTRVEFLLQNIRVVAVAATPVADAPNVDAVNAQGTPIAEPTNAPVGVQPPDAKANPGAGMVTLELSPDQVQKVQAALERGSLSLALRNHDDPATTENGPVFQDQFGAIPRPPTVPAP